MSRQKLKSRDKITQKMSRDGLILKNETTCEIQHISKREEQLNLKDTKLDKATYSQVGNRLEKKSRRKKNKFKNKSELKETQNINNKDLEPLLPINTNKNTLETSKYDTKYIIDTTSSNKLTIDVEDTKIPINPKIHTDNKVQSTFSQVGKSSNKKGSTTPIKITQEGNPEIKTGTLEINDTPNTEIEANQTIITKEDNKSNQPLEPKEPPIKHDKPSKLNFSKEESNTDKLIPHKLIKAQQQVDKAQTNVEKAQSKLPSNKKLHVERVFDEVKGKSKTKIFFEDQVKSEIQHLKGSLPLRPVKATANIAIANAHRKLFQVEDENVGTKAAHKGSMIVESGVRSALKFNRSLPYRKVEKLQTQVAKSNVKLNYEKLIADNPKLSSNILSRMVQKQKIKKQYAKAKRDTEKAAAIANKATSTTSRVSKVVVEAVRKHPFVSIVIVLVAFLMFVFMSLFGLGTSIGNASLSGILNASYLSEDADIDLVELNYSQWETDLIMKIENIESSNPRFDEYRYNTGDISHNPYELMAYLTTVYQYFSYEAIEADLKKLFDEQYKLTLSETTETRYKEPDGEPYEWKVLTITLNARSFEEVIQSKINTSQRQHFELLMETKGSRQYAANPFITGWLPYVTSYYGYRVNPISGEKELHKGVDIGFPKGTEIHSVQDGTVTFAGENGGYGNIVVIEDDKGFVTKYAHCDSISVNVGQAVKSGDVIAIVGNTGNSTGAHLHLEVLKDGQYLNPLIYVDSGKSELSPIYKPPGAAMGDGSYAALIAEAESHLGKPYVFGANGPNSFDCSSYICYILSNSGVKNMPRTTAQGIYNQTNPIAESERKPGDLVFFKGTYSTTNTVTHVGLYVGDGYMIHAGSPIQYTKIDGNPYWNAHFYSYGRID